MVTLQIEPIATTTKGEYDAKITGININDLTLISGEVSTPGEGTIKVNWDINGLADNQTDTCNLDTKSPEFSAIRDATMKINV